MFKKFLLFILIISLSGWQNMASAYTENIRWLEVKTSDNSRLLIGRVDFVRIFLNSNWMPYSFKGFHLFVDGKQREPRGKVQGKYMTLTPHTRTNSEFIKLLAHEIGHFVDLYKLTSKDHKGDPSNEFYKISWQSRNVKYPGTSMKSFISGYGASNKYEDFAECFVWYIFHNSDFIDRAIRHEDIRKKYIFFATYVFPHGQFQGTDFTLHKVPNYIWDTTKVPIFFQNYLYFLR